MHRPAHVRLLHESRICAHCPRISREFSCESGLELLGYERLTMSANVEVDYHDGNSSPTALL